MPDFSYCHDYVIHSMILYTSNRKAASVLYIGEQKFVIGVTRKTYCQAARIIN